MFDDGDQKSPPRDSHPPAWRKRLKLIRKVDMDRKGSLSSGGPLPGPISGCGTTGLQSAMPMTTASM